MRTLEGLYKAVCLGVDNQGEVIRCQVPQIFNDETVTCFDVAGGVFPLEGDEGWVVFESGFPDHPVWLAAADGISSPDVTPGAGVIDVTAGPGIGVTPGQHPVVSNLGVITIIAGQRVTVNNANPQMPVVTATPQYAAGGAINTLLAKNSATDYDTKWVTPASLGFVAKAGDTMTGRLWVEVGNAPAVSMAGTGVHMEWWTTGRAARTGYIQGNGASGLNFVSEMGPMYLNGPDGSTLNFGSMNIGTPSKYGGAYRGLNWGAEYMIMTDGGTNTFVTAPGAGGNVYIRASANGTAGLTVGSNGQVVASADLVAGSWLYSNGGYLVLGSAVWNTVVGWYNSGDNTYVRSLNDKHVWLGGGWYGGNGGISIGFGGVSNRGYICDINGRGYFGGGISIPNGAMLTLIDDNHGLFYSAATPAYSGEAANGPQLRGWGTVWLHTIAGGYGGNYGWDAFLSPNGHWFISPGCGFYNFSSREFKDDIQTIDPQDCLAQVLAWRPVEFTYGGGLDRPGTGFIAEEMVEVTPTAVNVTGPDNERPGWANAMNYPSLTVQLAGAVQALAAEVKALKEAA